MNSLEGMDLKTTLCVVVTCGWWILMTLGCVIALCKCAAMDAPSVSESETQEVER